MKRTALQKHNRAMNKANACYKAWMMSEAGTRCAARRHRHYCRYLRYMHALEAAQEINS